MHYVVSVVVIGNSYNMINCDESRATSSNLEHPVGNYLYVILTTLAKGFSESYQGSTQARTLDISQLLSSSVTACAGVDSIRTIGHPGKLHTTLN